MLAGAVLSTVVLLAGWPLARRPLVSLLAVLEATPLRPLLTSAPAPGSYATDASAIPPHADRFGADSYGAFAEQEPTAGRAPPARREAWGPGGR